MRAWTVVISLALLAASNSSHAEIYQGIRPLASLTEVKQLFPNATFTKSVPGWAADYEVLYQITGTGISGTIVVKLDDENQAFRNTYDQYWSQAGGEGPGFTPSSDNIRVQWVRWVPDSPVPLQNVIAKYGKPEKSGVRDSDFQPYKEWTTKGVEAGLDEKGRVIVLNFNFSASEIRAGNERAKVERIRLWNQIMPPL